jgi:Na+-driven multidrug efflux pump
MRMHWKSLKEILYIGVPAGFQGSCFSLANILIQAAINSFGSAAVAGNTASVQWEGFFFVAYGAFGQTVVSFVGQNLGGKQYRRIWQSVKYCILYSTIFALTATLLLWIFSYQSLALFNENPEVVKWGILRYKVILPAIWLGGLMEIFISALRGLGYSIGPSIIMIFGVCVFRIVWLWTVFKWSHTMVTLLLTLPISWLVIPLVTGTYFYLAIRKYRNI